MSHKFFMTAKDSVYRYGGNMMEIQQIKYFVEVVHNENFTKAATQLFVTQPMLTRAIKQLEQELDVQLIERTSKSFHLTDAGAVFYTQAQEFLIQYDKLHQAMRDVSVGQCGKVNLSIPGVLLDIYFPPLFSSFQDEYPGIVINVTEEGSKSTAEAVQEGRADLGLVMLPVNEQFRFETKLLIHDVCQLLVSRNHHFAQRECVHISELEGEPVLTFNETATLHDVFIKLCIEHGFFPHITYKSLMSGFSFQMVSMEQCIAMLPLPVILQGLHNKNLVTVPITPTIPWNIAVIRRAKGYHSFAATYLYNHICKYFSRQYLHKPFDCSDILNL